MPPCGRTDAATVCNTNSQAWKSKYIMVWGSFAVGKVGDLHRIVGILNQKGYHNILQCHALPSGKRLVGKGFILQQDNDPKHSSHYCQNYLKKKEKEKELKIMTWPPQSPDLNRVSLG